MNKKALSPLAATIILVVFALIIGTVTMNIGENYSGEEEPPEEEGLGSSIVIDINDVLGDDLKELQIKYITDKITREEYLEKEKEIIKE